MKFVPGSWGSFHLHIVIFWFKGNSKKLQIYRAVSIIYLDQAQAKFPNLLTFNRWFNLNFLCIIATVLLVSVYPE